ncbi:unnamed protein product [Phytophthora fragariaefolia]|uniref:Unnamed protein product n=1 Tax=Phytophthora fragariaefolia TaxID=1490495 RepID=A0A9W6XXE8_9STRA|nr:unnamed protein product [Phytophthora fragariaefolia]
MHTTFTDAEDKLLVQLACQFEREGLRITWPYVAQRMKTHRAARQLRLRLANLKRTYGKSLSGFPPRFFSGPTTTGLFSVAGHVLPPPRISAGRDSSCSARGGLEGPTAPSIDCLAGVSVVSGGDYIVSDEGSAVACHYLPMLRDEQAAQAVNSIFGNISASEVHQQAGRTYYNAGEILPSGVSRILTAVGSLTKQTSFSMLELEWATSLPTLLLPRMPGVVWVSRFVVISFRLDSGVYNGISSASHALVKFCSSR